MKTITISLADSAEDETVTAEYFQFEGGWVTFKTEDHKAVVAYPENRVIRIKSEERAANGLDVTINAAGHASAEQRDAYLANVTSDALRWGLRS